LNDNCVPLVIGENVRDYSITSSLLSIFPYHKDSGKVMSKLPNDLSFHFWRYRTNLKNRKDYGEYIENRGLKWYEHSMFFSRRYLSKFSITFAFVATHNHFVLDTGGSIFKQSAPVIKLFAKANIDDHLNLIGLLNSSTALFWGRQTFFPKGGYASGKWEERLEWDGTKLMKFPVTKKKPYNLTKTLELLGKKCAEFLPTSLIPKKTISPKTIEQNKTRFFETREAMIALQEELDWQCYNYYQITDKELWLPDIEAVPRVKLGERAFEIVIARKMESGELETSWFERHGSTPSTEIPDYWPEEYQQLVQRRIELIESDKNIRLIEQPEYKRRWMMEPWDKQITSALEQWLLNRLEYKLSGRDLMAETDPQPATKEPRLISCAQLADLLRGDENFLQVAELYKGRPDFNVTKLVEELVNKESVPFLPVMRYKPSGLRKRQDWEHTWELQRHEDAIDAHTKLNEDHPDYLTPEDAERLKKKSIGDIAVPPKYQAKDFMKSSYWKLRGKLDVPKERFISYPGLERETEQSLIITWAGWDHLQQAKALSNYIEEAKTMGWPEHRLIPMLAGLLELLPWLQQWHNEIDPNFGDRMGDFFAGYLEDEARMLGKTIQDLKNWTPNS
jgi:hypothetical protein